MAILHPPLSSLHPTSAGAYRERDILAILEQGLPAGFDVFHNVDWSSLYGGSQSFGELDAVVVAPSGHVALLEVKAGDLSTANHALIKIYSHAGDSKTKDVGQQARRQHSAMMGRLADEGLGTVHLAHMLILPDYTVGAGSVAYPRDRITDSTQMDTLCSRVKAALPSSALPDAVRVRVMAFFANEFCVQPDFSMHLGQVQKANISLAEGLATWVPRITHTGAVYMVDATAGSGKSQLALNLLQDAASKRLRCAYLCYNRPLADHMTGLAPATAEISTFHEYCVGVSRSNGIEPDFGVKGVFEAVAQHLVEHADTQAARLDLLIVDESQDFDPLWVQALLPRLKEDGKLYVLGDSNQQLYGRDDFDLSDAVHISCMDNFRNPRRIVQAINQFKLSPEPIQARSVHLGQAPGFHTYVDAGKESVTALERCLKELLKAGHTADQIAVITFAGRERSTVLGQESLAGLKTTRFTGKYDTASNPIWTDGDLLVETLYRFKGQSAPVIVLCEVDFEALGDKERRKLFVGFTRAQFRLECVLTERSAQLLLEQ